MPPRDKTTDSPVLLNDNQEGESSSYMEKLVQDAKAKADLHNIKTHVGFFRNTFHYEMNLVSALFLYLLYNHVGPQGRLVLKILGVFVALDAARYYYKKGPMAGCPYTLPFVSLVTMVIFPVRFWAEMGCIAMENGGVCTNIMGGVFMVFITDTKLCRDVMTGEGTFGIYAHPNALWLFGPRNLIYMDKEPHKAFRAILSPSLFSKPALVEYAKAQERVCRKFMHKYVQQCEETGKPIDVRIAFRKMAAASSQEAFLGPYLNDARRDHLEKDIVTFTLGFLSFPIPFFNTGLHKAIQAKDRIEETICDIVVKAHAYVKACHPPRCLMERWCQAIQQTAKERGVAPQDVPGMADDDVARTVLDFLFAAQDATNSALAYSLDVLDEDRFVLSKVREEIDREFRTRDHDIGTKMNDAESMKYTIKVANQLLHHKPPVPMIPHMTKKNTTLGNVPIYKGTVVIPSITYSARTSGRSVKFEPEREDPDSLFVQTVVFGGGQHKCPGRRYAESLLTVFIAVFAQEFDVERVNERPKVDQLIYFPTCFPRDCDFVIKNREY